TLWQPSWACPKDGYFYPPTLFTDVTPSSTIAQIEIFGPVLVAMSFRTHGEAVKLANNTRYGLAASVWTENINLALDIAPKIKAGTVWINCTNVFDAASGFGGYRESGFGREGGIEGLFEYVKHKSSDKLSVKPKSLKRATAKPKKVASEMPAIDKTHKMYIGGKQARPDGGYSMDVISVSGNFLGEVSRGNRKDIRNAVEAAQKSSKWGSLTGHSRAQVLYFLAENLAVRQEEFADRLVQMLEIEKEQAILEVEQSIERIYYYAAQADKYDGRVHHTTFRNVTLAMPEAIGVIGIVCPDESPLLGLISTIIPAITMGNTVVVVPSEKHPFSATDLYQVFDTSDIPAGTINIVTGEKSELSQVLAKHDNLDGLWYFGTKDGSREVELHGTENMKRTWVNYGKYRDWQDSSVAAGELFLRNASQIKNIWIPYGE
ncbi:MAG: aldehyde dehydrogenase family protein, partial [Saprospiraceae bacterium]|nr:aldehyde dehydrogenase family protein [Saprospiraceae bacterium]